MAEETKDHLPVATERDLGPDEYTPNEREKAAIGRWGAKRDAASPAPRIKIKKTGPNEYGIRYDHKSQTLAELLVEEAIGTADDDFRAEIVSQLANGTMTNGEVSQQRLNFALSVVKGIKPVDAVETLLAVQMAIVHCALTNYATCLGGAKTADQQDRAEVGTTKLARTFVAQVEALKRHRSKGEQVVRVERVYIGPGAQAVVGNITQGAGGPPKEKQGQIHETRTYGPALSPPDGSALPVDFTANKEPVRERIGAREDPMPLSRSPRRRASGEREQPQTRAVHRCGDRRPAGSERLGENGAADVQRDRVSESESEV